MYLLSCLITTGSKKITQDVLDGPEYSELVTQVRDQRDRLASIQSMLGGDPGNAVLLEMQTAIEKSIAELQRQMAELLLQ